MEVSIAIDCMGGDHGPAITVPTALDYLRRSRDVRIVLVGQEQAIGEEMRKCGAKIDSRLTIQHASEVVAMDESPAAALRGKKDSSIRIAVNLVRDGKVQACVSAGNTGALMAISKFVLKTLPDIDRPAICSVLPTLGGHTYMLDLGANVDCTARHLLQFAIMGAALVSSVEDKPNPRVGLLNIGSEEIKGNEVVKQAAELLRSSGLNFCGNVEGDDVYKDGADVVVCDGFVGNVALKASEGLVRVLGTYLQQEFKRNFFTRVAGLISLPVLNAFKRRIDPRMYNGATLLGLRGIVIKSHGSADQVAFGAAITRAVEEARGEVISHIAQRMANMSAVVS